LVRLRLWRGGKKKQPIYRIVAAHGANARNGKYIELVGQYNPGVNPVSITLSEDRIYHWLSVGAQPSDTVRSLLQRKGVWLKWGLMKKGADEATIAEQFARWESPQEEKHRRVTEKKTRRKAARKKKGAAEGAPAAAQPAPTAAASAEGEAVAAPATEAAAPAETAAATEAAAAPEKAAAPKKTAAPDKPAKTAAPAGKKAPDAGPPPADDAAPEEKPAS